MARHAKPKPLFLQMSMLKVDSAYAWLILSMQTADLCYAQPMNNEISLRLPLTVTPVRILPVNKILRNLGRIQFIAKSSSMYTKICSRQDITQTFGVMSPPNFHRKLILLKLKIKKLLRKISSKNLTGGV